MSAILKFDFKKEKQKQKQKDIYVFWKKIITTQKIPKFACDNYIFHKTRTSSWPISPPLITVQI